MSDTPNGGSAYQNGNVQHYANAGNGDTDGPRMVSFAPASGITEDFNLNLDDIFNGKDHNTPVCISNNVHRGRRF